MKKLLAFVGLVAFAAPLTAGNLLINPGFDETPWDTGWTGDTVMSSSVIGDGAAYPGAFVTSEAGLSLPHCCLLSTPLYIDAGLYGGANASARAEIMQNFNPITSCTLKVYTHYSVLVPLGYDNYNSASIEIQLHINGNWQQIWSCDTTSTVSEWIEICTTFAEETIDGIKFVADVYAYAPRGEFDKNGMVDFWVDDVYVGGTEVGVEEEPGVKRLKLSAYPNPFISSTKVEYELPKATDVNITIYNLSGQEVATLVQGNKNAGHHTASWDGRDKSGEKVATGIYFYRMEAGKFKATKKLTIIR